MSTSSMEVPAHARPQTAEDRDARLAAAVDKVARLVSPRNVVMVGASDRPGAWSARVWKNLDRYHFRGSIYPINPKREEIYGTRCYGSFEDLPEPPDLLLVLVPAAGVPGVLREAAAAGARSAIVYTAGFGEVHEEAGDRLDTELRKVIAETGLAVIGPNCLGSVFGPAGLVTMTDERKLDLATGPVALVGQSGGVMLFCNRVLAEKGIGAGYLVTSGNESGLTTADYIAFFAQDPEIKVIVSYLEAVRDPEHFLAACRMAQQAGKPIVLLKLGASEAGREAAMAHTGALAGSMEAFDAVAGAAGVIRAETLDDVVEIVDYVVHAPLPRGGRLGAITLSGAYRGLLMDAAARNGLEFPPLAEATRTRLDEHLGVGTLVSNPLDGGFGVLSSAETFLATVRAMLDDPGIDILLVQEEVPRDPLLKRSERYLREVHALIEEGAAKPIAFISMVTHSENDFSRGLRAELPRLAFLHEANKGLSAVAALARYEAFRRTSASSVSFPPPPRHALIDRIREIASASPEPRALNERESKELVGLYGIASPRETMVASEKEAVAAAERIGYPVVLKGVSAAITHKSDAGIVLLGLASAEDVAAAYRHIASRVAAVPGAELDGVLVCEEVRHALEVSLGLHRDPEVGTVIMVGSGGVLIELFRDVAFAAPPLTREAASGMIDRTRMASRLAGFRGAPAYDREALVDALVALSRLALDLGDVVGSIDINPFALRSGRGGGLALDALVVVERRQTGDET